MALSREAHLRFKLRIEMLTCVTTCVRRKESVLMAGSYFNMLVF
jgi:hypothetical protein